MAIVVGSIGYFCQIMITYSNEQKLDSTYLRKKSRSSVRFEYSGTNVIKDPINANEVHFYQKQIADLVKSHFQNLWPPLI